MVANLTVGKPGFEDAAERLGQLALTAQELKDKLLADIDRDSIAFDSVMAARRLPKKTEEQKQARAIAIDEAFLAAARVPVEVMERAVAVLELALEVAKDGNPASVSDAGCAALAAIAALRGAQLNVTINLPDCPEGPEKQQIATRAKQLLARGQEVAADTERVVAETLDQE
jgi:formiminotetrahydrofolate cyclodeaminase